MGNASSSTPGASDAVRLAIRRVHRSVRQSIKVKFAEKAGGCWPSHQHAVSLRPFDDKFAAVEDNRCCPIRAPAAYGSDQYGTGAGPTGSSDACRALPHPHADPVRCQHGGEFDIRPFGKHRVTFEDRTNLRQRYRIDIVDKENRVRVAEVDATAIISRSVPERHMQCIG